MYSPAASDMSEPTGLRTRMVTATGRVDKVTFDEARSRSRINRAVASAMATLRDRGGHALMLLTEGRGLAAGRPRARQRPRPGGGAADGDDAAEFSSSDEEQ